MEAVVKQARTTRHPWLDVMPSWILKIFKNPFVVPRITDEIEGSDDCKHTSGGVFVAHDSGERRVAQAWVNFRRCLRVFAVYFWHSEGWTPRKESLMEETVKQARTTRHPWLMACDANMDRQNVRKSAWFKEQCTIFEASKASRLRERMTTSLPAEVCKARSSIPSVRK